MHTTSTRQQRWLRAAGIMLLIYGLIEVTDCLTLVLMQLGLIGNLYPPSIFEPFNQLLNDQPILVLPMFFFYTALRLGSGVGVLRNRLWGLWLTLFVSGATIVAVPFLLPLSGFDLLACAAIVSIVLIVYGGSQPILGERASA